ncbi:hypothetical protein K502DRAFT_322550 [Neoconidiobolus thromboides FSU 785]|nr:hypothetical protein K502DRAFT_322550 [Neoconidiobolus thromboides FSU 785]
MDALETTQCILAISPEHIRSFEEANGIQEILCLVKKKKSQTELRWKTLEFLFFYLLPEHDRSQKMDQSLIKSSEEKQEFIAQLLGQVFVNELQKIFSF